MYKPGDRVVKIEETVASTLSRRYAPKGVRGSIVSTAASVSLVRWDGGEYDEEGCVAVELVRESAWDMFVQMNGRAPTLADVGEVTDGIQLLNLYPSGEIIGDGPQPPAYVDDGYGYTFGAVAVDRPKREVTGLSNMTMQLSDSERRKMMPVGTVVTEYFPDGLLGVAAVSWVGNEKHNPGERLHWSRGKSHDHIDAELRHAIDAAREGADGWDTVELPDGRVFQVRHKAAKAWRALADAQLDAESVSGQVIRRLK